MPADLLITFGSRVRQLRLSLGLSQEKLAEMAGLHRTYVGSVERCEKNITLKNVEKLAKVLGVSVVTLFLEDLKKSGAGSK